MARYKFGKKSLEHLSTIDLDLQKAIRLALKWGIMDFSVIEGRRSLAKQNKLCGSGKSKLLWPQSKHNVLNKNDLARAVDVAPFIDGRASWDHQYCLVLAGVILAAGRYMGVSIRWGGNWSGNPADIGKQKFNDLVHFERI